jgi:hypothetical protein
MVKPGFGASFVGSQDSQVLLSRVASVSIAKRESRTTLFHEPVNEVSMTVLDSAAPARRVSEVARVSPRGA